ncbi:DgyrCDS10169 [Dimorphilus gyrociliatus]|uniref:DgyrCDS10169 n=1 Tax=Dimorphilus gyrociliatus TaxID=2664684 RepID=A0A7I8W4H1_9ANNE|nr:DgyrCDS10169 [Dimorphilus gyrociliatus]
MIKLIVFGLFTFGLALDSIEYVKFGASKKGTTLKHLSTFQLDYFCIGEKFIKIELYVYKTLIWHNTWSCSNEKGSRSIVVPLPKVLAYKPSQHNRIYWTSSKCNFELCILHPKLQRCSYSKVKTEESFSIPPPYQRKQYHPNLCFTPFQEILYNKPFRPICKLEAEVFKAIKYPVAFNGERGGVVRVLPNYNSKILEKKRLSTFTKPKFTLDILLYVDQYCKNSDVCSLIQRHTWDDRVASFLIYILRTGQLRIQVVAQGGIPAWAETSFTIPLQTWFRLILSADNNLWNMQILHGKNLNVKEKTLIQLTMERPVHYDDSFGLLVFGGSEIINSFTGIIAMATIYRRKYYSAKTIPDIDSKWLYEMKDESTICNSYINWFENRVWRAKLTLEAINRKRSCNRFMNEIFFGKKSSFKRAKKTCAAWKQPEKEKFKLLGLKVRKSVFRGHIPTLIEAGRLLYRNVTDVLNNPNPDFGKLERILEESSCYGNNNATALLAAMLNNGFGIRMQERKSGGLLLKCAMKSHRSCLQSLGAKHNLGLDSFPQDYEISYNYYKALADITGQDRLEHHQEGVVAEKIRLTDEVQLKLQTDDQGDLWNWITHQASHGVNSAREHASRLLFWGAQGIRRNLQAAVNYYREGAEQGNTIAQYDYGIALLKGHGTEKNETAAIHQLSKAASKGNPNALNALGWHALEVEGDIAKATKLFERAMGRGLADAAHNLGHMYMEGRTINKEIDKVKAFDYFSFAAVRGQLDSAIVIAMFNIRGHPKAVRNPELAVTWARYVSEENPIQGTLMANGLKAYRHGNIPSALLWYSLAAESGIEVANFNLAWLCENYEQYTRIYFHKECVFRNYEISIKRDKSNADPYGQLLQLYLLSKYKYIYIL